MIGERVGGLEIAGVLGNGQLGPVYRARDARRRAEIALRIVPPPSSERPLPTDEILEEAGQAARMHHPRVAGVLGTRSVDERGLILAELVDGRTLEERQGDGPFELLEALRIAEGVAAALQAASEYGLVHGALVPRNVMMTPSGDVKVLDFGIATWRQFLLDSRSPDGSETAGDTDRRRESGARRQEARESHQAWSPIRHRDYCGLGKIIEDLVGDPMPQDVADIVRRCKEADSSRVEDRAGGIVVDLLYARDRLLSRSR